PVLGRPDAAASGQLGIVAAGPAEALTRCRPLFERIGKRVFEAGGQPEAATSVKLANNFVLGCALQAMAEAFSLVRKTGGDPQVLYEVMTEGLFAAPAYKVYGRLMVDQAFEQAGFTTRLALKDMNLVLAAGAAQQVPLPSVSLLRDRLLGAMAHGEAERDWAVLAREQARAAGLELEAPRYGSDRAADRRQQQRDSRPAPVRTARHKQVVPRRARAGRRLVRDPSGRSAYVAGRERRRQIDTDEGTVWGLRRRRGRVPAPRRASPDPRARRRAPLWNRGNLPGIHAGPLSEHCAEYLSRARVQVEISRRCRCGRHASRGAAHPRPARPGAGYAHHGGRPRRRAPADDRDRQGAVPAGDDPGAGRADGGAVGARDRAPVRDDRQAQGRRRGHGLQFA